MNQTQDKEGQGRAEKGDVAVKLSAVLVGFAATSATFWGNWTTYNSLMKYDYSLMKNGLNY